MGAQIPFRRAARLVGHFRNVEVSEATVRRATEKSGQAQVELQTKEVAALEGEFQEAAEGPALQQLSVDGAMVPLLHGEWGEVKTLAIGVIEEPAAAGEVHAREMSYFSRMTDHQSFARLAAVETHRRGVARAGRVCAVVTERSGSRSSSTCTGPTRCAFWTGVTAPNTWPGPVRRLSAVGRPKPAIGWEDSSMS